jgi:hypothetical protein
METVFIKHKIESEKDLPKKEGYYIIYYKDVACRKLSGIEYWYMGTNEEKKDLLENAAYWLEEIKLPSKKEMEKASFDFATIENGTDLSLANGFIAGCHYLKSLITK